MTDEPKDIQITLTKEFHTDYWKERASSLQWGILGFGVAITFMICGVLLQMFPQYTPGQMISLICIYIAVMTSAFAFGVHIGIRYIGHMINGRIHEEHPELFPNLEKAGESNVEKED